MKALFVLNGVAQLDQYRDRLRSAAVVVCDLSMDPATIRSKIGDGPRLLAYANAGKLFMGGLVNPVWAEWRRRLLGIVYAGSIKDPGDPTTHLLIEPTIANAEAYAKAIAERVRTAGFSGAYIDDSWLGKPVRILEVESRGTGATPADVLQIRWEAYLRVFFGTLWHLGIGAWANCGGDTADFHPTPCAEVNPAHAPCELIPVLLGGKHGPRALPDQPILWFGGVGVDGLILEGERL